MEEWYENLHEQIGIFVTSPGLRMGITVGRFNSIHTFLMLPNGDVVRRPTLWCNIIRPPDDPNMDFPLDVQVIVHRGRLLGMFGRVIGSYNGRVFMRTLDGSVPQYDQAINKFERKCFVEDASCLSLWQTPLTPKQAYPGGFYVKLKSRGC